MLDGSSSGSVVYSSGGSITVDGITARDGDRGMYHTSGNGLTVSNCTFEENGPSSGGGMYVSTSSNVLIENTLFRNNTTPDAPDGNGQDAPDGGGLYLYSASATVSGRVGKQLKALSGLKPVRWGKGIYGPFAGRSIKGTVSGR